MQTTKRTGFTLVELLVVIAIIGMLAAIVLPAVQQVKESANRAKCVAQQHNIHLAIEGYEKRKNYYPGYVNRFNVQGTDQKVSWVVLVLSDLGRDDLKQGFKDTSGNKPPLATLKKTFIEILACPSDGSKTPGDSQLSYAVNGGADPYDKDRAKDDGIFYDHWQEPFIQVSSSNVKDRSTTMMIAENRETETWGKDTPTRNGLCFLFNKNAKKDAGPIVNVEGKKTAPSSYHPGGAVVTFCDGKTHFLDDNVDESVYAALVTPNGSRSSYAAIEKQNPLVEGEY